MLMRIMISSHNFIWHRYPDTSVAEPEPPGAATFRVEPEPIFKVLCYLNEYLLQFSSFQMFPDSVGQVEGHSLHHNHIATSIVFSRKQSGLPVPYLAVVVVDSG